MLVPIVQQLGVRVQKAQSNFLIVVAVYDDTGRYNNTDIADFITDRRELLVIGRPALPKILINGQPVKPTRQRTGAIVSWYGRASAGPSQRSQFRVAGGVCAGNGSAFGRRK